MLEFLCFFPRVGLGDPGAQMRPGVERRDSNGQVCGVSRGDGDLEPPVLVVHMHCPLLEALQDGPGVLGHVEL